MEISVITNELSYLHKKALEKLRQHRTQIQRKYQKKYIDQFKETTKNKLRIHEETISTLILMGFCISKQKNN